MVQAQCVEIPLIESAPHSLTKIGSLLLSSDPGVIGTPVGENVVGLEDVGSGVVEGHDSIIGTKFRSVKYFNQGKSGSGRNSQPYTSRVS